VWSVLVGINTTVTFSFIGSGIRSRGPSVLVILGPLYLAGMLAALAAWFFVVRYLRLFIVPNFFWTPSGDLEQDPGVCAAFGQIGRFLFIPICFRGLLAIFDFALNSAAFGG